MDIGHTLSQMMDLVFFFHVILSMFIFGYQQEMMDLVSTEIKGKS